MSDTAVDLTQPSTKPAPRIRRCPQIMAGLGFEEILSRAG